MKLSWKAVNHRYGPNSVALYLGRLPVGHVGHAIVSRNEPPRFVFECRLPGLKKEILTGSRPSEDEAKTALVKAVETWLGYVGGERPTF